MMPNILKLTSILKPDAITNGKLKWCAQSQIHLRSDRDRTEPAHLFLFNWIHFTWIFLYFQFRRISSFTRASITKHHWLGGLNNRNVLSHSSEGQQSAMDVPSGLVSPEGSVLGPQMPAFPLRLQGGFHLCASVFKSLLLARTPVRLNEGSL